MVGRERPALIAAEGRIWESPCNCSQTPGVDIEQPARLLAGALEAVERAAVEADPQ